jgi:hypothetical protein
VLKLRRPVSGLCYALLVNANSDSSYTIMTALLREEGRDKDILHRC